MVATLCKLKFAIIRNSWRRSTATLVFTLLGFIAMLPLIPLVGVGAAAAGLRLDQYQSEIGAVVIGVGVVVMVLWTLMPLLFFGSDETLDPRRFALFPIPRGQLTAGLFASSFIGLPGLFTALGMLAVVLVWIRHPAAIVAGAVGIVLGVALCVILSRCVTTLASQGLSSRRGRDLTAGISVLFVVAISLGFQFASQAAAQVAETEGAAALSGLRTLVRVLSFTPLGAPWAIGSDAATGQWTAAMVHLVISLLSVVALGWVWSVGLARAMITPLSTSGGAKARSDNAMIRATGRGWWPLRLAPAVAIMTRSMRYWRTDPRYLTNMLVVPLIPIMFVVMAKTVPDYPAVIAVFGVPFAAMMVGFSLSNDVASDSTAFWMHVITDVRGWADRLGRALAVLAWSLPAIVILSVAVLAVVDELDRWPAGVGMSIGVLLAGVGVSCVASTLVVYPVALPGESPWATRSGRGSMRSMAGMAVLGITLVISVPFFVLGALGTYSDPSYGWITLGLGIVLGPVLTGLGVWIGGRVYERRCVPVLAQLMSYDS